MRLRHHARCAGLPSCVRDEGLHGRDEGVEILERHHP
jgi:hypothetical protein